MTMELQATPEEVMRAVEVLREFAVARKMPEKIIFGLTLALEECGSNIVNHALRKDARQKFRIAFGCERDQMLIELRDPGLPFDPTAFEANESPANDDDLPGGWGIQIVRRYMDEIRYSRQGDENVLLLIKRIEEPAMPNTNF
jgi:anti-sigma regulatory factor (Ser/Thr protein kinase)